VNIVLAVATARDIGSTVGLGAQADSSIDILWWVAPVSLVAVVAMILLEVGKRVPPTYAIRHIADRATNPLAGVVVGLIVLGGWRLSQVVVSVVVVGVMIVFEFCKSLPAQHRYRQAADKLTAPLAAIAIAVVFLCGWQVAEIIGFVG
jgi:hypothetical protein